MNLPSVKPALLAFCVLLAGCSKKEEEVTPVVAVQTATVKRGPIQLVIAAQAVLWPVQQSAVTPKISAPVLKFFVNRGSRVKQGELLATLENRDLRGALQQAEANYESTTKASLPEDIKKAQLDVTAAKQELDAEQKLFTSREELFNQGALPRKDLDQARVSYTQAQNQYTLAQQHLEALESVSAAQTKKSAAGQLETAAANVSYSEIRAPISGVVTERPLFPGELASAGTPLLTIMDTSRVIAKAHIPQEQAALVKAGDPAQLEAADGQTRVPAKITLVSPATDPNSTTIEIWAEAANKAGSLRPGTTVGLSVVARKIPDALTVPASAILKTDSGAAVMTIVEVTAPDGCKSLEPKKPAGGEARSEEPKDKGKPETVQCARQQPVQPGVQSGDQVQITSGLKEGQTIIATGAYGLPDFTEVKPQGAEQKESGEDKNKDQDK
ncbi:MAG: efflux RND transporter periplasmic adaptor subunit [Acidobacteria bacterium]|nr:efflux RND transporter periplasmic adaptor subunit [Acidobacteriota bacterium]